MAGIPRPVQRPVLVPQTQKLLHIRGISAPPEATGSISSQHGGGLLGNALVLTCWSRCANRRCRRQTLLALWPWRRTGQLVPDADVNDLPVRHSGFSESMSNPQVLEWLPSLGEAFQDYVDPFRVNGVDGSLLKELTESELEELGMHNKFHRRVLIHAMQGNDGTGNAALALQRRLSMTDSTNLVKKDGAFIVNMAPQVWQELESAGLQVDHVARVVGEDLDSMLVELTSSAMCMEAVEMMTHCIICQSAVVCDSRGSVESSVMQGAKMDMMQILESKRASRTAFAQVKSGADQLIADICSFCKAAHRHLTDEERAEEIKLLESAFERWHEHASKTAEGIVIMSDDLMDHTKRRMQMLHAGGGAVSENVIVYEQAAEGLKQAAEKCKTIQDLADPKIQMALRARKGALEAEISATDRDIAELRKEKAFIAKVREAKETVIASQVQFMLEQNEKKPELKWWDFRDRIGFAERQRDQAEKEKKELDVQMDKIQTEIGQKESCVAEMRLVETEWEAIIKSAGLEEYELEVKARTAQLHIAAQVSCQAMRDTGVAKPEKAAEVITTQQQAQFLLSSAASAASRASDAAARTKAWPDMFRRMIGGFRGQEATSKGMRSLAKELQPTAEVMMHMGGVHVERMRCLDNPSARHAIIRKFITGVMLDPALQPEDLTQQQQSQLAIDRGKS